MVHPYPTPKLGISARHAVSNLSGCRGKLIEITFVYVDRARNCAKNDTKCGVLACFGTGFGHTVVPLRVFSGVFRNRFWARSRCTDGLRMGGRKVVPLRVHLNHYSCRALELSRSWMSAEIS